MITWKSILQFLGGMGVIALLGLAVFKLVPKAVPPAGWQTLKPPNDVMALIEYGGAVLSGGKDGLARIDYAGAEVQVVRADVPLEYVTALALDGKGGYWVGHGGGASHFDGQSWRTYTKADGLPDDTVLALICTRRGETWLGTPHGIARLDAAGRWQAYHTADGLANEAANVIFEDAQGRLWFGNGYTTAGGLSLFDGQTWRTYSTADGLAHNNVNAITQSDDGALWFATGFSSRGGVSRFDGAAWTNLHVADGLAGGKARSIFIDSRGAFWIGSEYDGIAHFSGDARYTLSKVYTPKTGLAGWEVKAMLEDTQGGLWLGTENGISHIQKGVW